MTVSDRPQKQRGANRKILLVFLLCCTLLLTVVSGLEWVLRGLGAILVIADPLVPAEAAMVLSGGDSTRIDEAARLYQEGFIGLVILTETGIEVPEWQTDYSSLMRFQAIEKGIPPDVVLLIQQPVESTIDEAKAALDFLVINNLKSVIVITDPYHTLRTRLIFRKVFQDKGIAVSVRPVREHWYRSRTWWLHRNGWKATIQEYIKIFGYMLGL